MTEDEKKEAGMELAYTLWDVVITAAIIALCLFLFPSCSLSTFNVSKKTTAIETNEITTVKIRTLFNGNSEVTKINVSQGMKSKDQGVSVGSVNQDSNATNLVPLVQAVVEGAVKGASTFLK